MKIAPATSAQLDTLIAIYSACKRQLREQCSDQWTEEYPNAEIIAEDIAAGTLFAATEGDSILGAVNLSSEDEPECADFGWEDLSGRFLAASRLAVVPERQKFGTGTALMSFAEEFARSEGCTSVRLLAYEGNGPLLRYYEKMGYRRRRGEARFPGRRYPFLPYEKIL